MMFWEVEGLLGDEGPIGRRDGHLSPHGSGVHELGDQHRDDLIQLRAEFSESICELALVIALHFRRSNVQRDDKVDVVQLDLLQVDEATVRRARPRRPANKDLGKGQLALRKPGAAPIFKHSDWIPCAAWEEVARERCIAKGMPLGE